MPQRQELTRAARTKLSRHGFTDVMSDTLAYGSDAGRVRADVEREANDNLGCHEISFQFAAFRPATPDVNAPIPQSVYFTFQVRVGDAFGSILA